MFGTRSLILWLLSLIPCFLSGQQLQGETVYTSFLIPSVIQFPANITSATFANKADNGNYTKVVITSSMVLGAKTNNATPATLLVTEGGRKHVINVVCSKGLTKKELTYNWTSVKDLEQFIASQKISKNLPVAKTEAPSTEQKKPANAERTVAVTQKATAVKKPGPVVQNLAVAKVRQQPDYDSLLHLGNALIGKLEFDSAIIAFEKAHSAKPKEKRATDLIQYAESASANLKRQQYLKDSVETAHLTAETFERANRAVIAKDWQNALQLYRKVLQLNPSPAQQNFSKRRIEAIEYQLTKP